MQIVILAAGKGKRMMPITKEMPKPMVPLKGKPKLQHSLEMLPKQINEVIIVINHLGEQIVDFFGDSFGGRKVKYVRQEKLNGTAGAVHACKNELNHDFLVMMGDDLYHRRDVEKIMKNEVAILGKEVKDVSRFGVIMIDKKGDYRGSYENNSFKGKEGAIRSNMVNTGLYKLNRNFFEYPLVNVSETEFGLPQTLASMAEDFVIKIEKATEWAALGNVDDIAIAEQKLDLFLEDTKQKQEEESTKI